MMENMPSETTTGKKKKIWRQMFEWGQIGVAAGVIGEILLFIIVSASYGDPFRLGVLDSSEAGIFLMILSIFCLAILVIYFLLGIAGGFLSSLFHFRRTNLGAVFGGGDPRAGSPRVHCV